MLGVYLHDSDLVLRTAFPILVNHLSEFLAPNAVPALSQAARHAGDAGPRARSARVVLVTGRTAVLTCSPRGGPAWPPTAGRCCSPTPTKWAFTG